MQSRTWHDVQLSALAARIILFFRYLQLTNCALSFGSLSINCTVKSHARMRPRPVLLPAQPPPAVRVGGRPLRPPAAAAAPQAAGRQPAAAGAAADGGGSGGNGRGAAKVQVGTGTRVADVSGTPARRRTVLLLLLHGMLNLCTVHLSLGFVTVPTADTCTT